MAPTPPVADPAVPSAAPPAPAAPLDSRALNARLTQANLSRVRGDWNAAIDHCVEVLQADPANAAAHALLGDIYAARGRREDAVQWYRMALELHPNPVDAAKLGRIEREIAAQEAQQAKSARRLSVTPVVQPTDGQAPVGTVALMGVSPRLWLRGITAAALAFLVVSGVILLNTKNRHAQDGTLARPLPDPAQMNSIAPAPGSIGALPPGHPGGPSIVPPGAGGNAPAPPHTGGSGLAPDTTTMARTIPAGFPDASQTGVRPFGTTARSGVNVPTAVIQGVRPMAHSGETPTFATLTGGMKLAQMSSLTTGDEAVLVLANPPTATNRDSFRQNAIRNVYRAARDAFATNAEAKQASVYIQTDLTEKGGSVLLVAHVDRDSALKSDPDAEQPDNLLSRLTSVQWGQ
jgi:hypothetical protein